MTEKGFLGRLFDLSFSEFITTKIIKGLFVLAIIGAAIGGLSVMFGMWATRSVMGIIGGLIIGSLLFLVFVILARVWMEVLIVMFRIAENTDRIANK